MKTTRNYTILLSIAFFVVSFFMIPVRSVGQTMSAAPDVINLNTQGNYENIQCIYGGVIPSGYVITGHSIQVSLNGTYIIQACKVDYCPVDNNLFVEIARAPFQVQPYVQAMANLGPKVLLVVGTFTVTNSNGDAIIYNVDRWDYIEIIKPGNKK